MRHLTAEQQIGLIERIRPFAKQWTFEVSCLDGNSEACEFGDEIRNLGIEAGFGVWSLGKAFRLPNTPPLVGVTVIQRERGALNPFAQILFDSFTQAQLKEVKASAKSSLESRHVEVLVGAKP